MKDTDCYFSVAACASVAATPLVTTTAPPLRTCSMMFEMLTRGVFAMHGSMHFLFVASPPHCAMQEAARAAWFFWFCCGRRDIGLEWTEMRMEQK